MTRRRLLVLLVALAALGIPAGILQAMCAGGSCAEEPGASRVPFCPLPDDLRAAISNGYREGRSADVLAVTASTPMFTEIGGLRLTWPAATNDARVPVVFWGSGVAPHLALDGGVTLDQITPIVAELLGFDRPFPEVRSGTSIPGVAAEDGAATRLVLLIAWKGIGTEELESSEPGWWRFLASLRSQGAGTLEATTGSLPLDPSATLTTIGTGGLPSQHGITGSFIRNDEGAVVEPFGDGAPVAVIASLGDDLEDADPRTLVGLVATDPRDRGLVGGGWYPQQDPVDVVIGDAAAAPLAVRGHLATGYGADDVPDVLGVVLDGGLRRMDRLTREIVDAATAATRGRALVVVAGTGAWERSRLAVADDAAIDAVEDAVPGGTSAVEAVVAGGIFLDQAVLREQQVTGQVVVDALRTVQTPSGERMFADAFQGFAVSFARYC